MMKKIVHYNKHPLNRITINRPAVVWPIDHPDSRNVSNTKPVFTSPVLSYDEDTGEFETLNTIYKPKR